MDIIIYWWLIPALIVTLMLHACYCLIEGKWNFKYDTQTAKESLMVTVIWPIGAAIVIVVIYAWVLTYLSTLNIFSAIIKRWRKK